MNLRDEKEISLYEKQYYLLCLIGELEDIGTPKAIEQVNHIKNTINDIVAMTIDIYQDYPEVMKISEKLRMK